ncbi:hypothetical protein B7494_g5872 [Chlorociboria aeruginascens]|nr:hypothetical protein B7494_g5872 [Chlorociboria aeruginascens]
MTSRIFIFTTALFLSGYVLQQQTVRDLREAIKPQPRPERPRIYLPPQFAVQENGADAQIYGDDAVTDGNAGDIYEELDAESKGRGVESGGEEAAQIPFSMQQEASNSVSEDVSMEEIQKYSQEILVDVSEAQDPAPSPMEKPMSRAARRKKIKEEILAAGEGESFKGYRRRMW